MNTRAKGRYSASNGEDDDKLSKDKQVSASTTGAEPRAGKTEVAATSVSTLDFTRYTELVQCHNLVLFNRTIDIYWPSQSY